MIDPRKRDDSKILYIYLDEYTCILKYGTKKGGFYTIFE